MEAIKKTLNFFKPRTSLNVQKPHFVFVCRKKLCTYDGPKPVTEARKPPQAVKRAARLRRLGQAAKKL